MNEVVFSLYANIPDAAKIAVAVYGPAARLGTFNVPVPFTTVTLYSLFPIFTTTLPENVALVVILTTAGSPSRMSSTEMVKLGSMRSNTLTLIASDASTM